MASYNMFCSYCNSKIFDSDRTCPQCGAPTKNPIYQEKKDNNTNTLDPLEPFGFIAGTDFELTFSVFDENETPLNLDGSEIRWTLCPYGQPNFTTLDLIGEIVDEGVFIVKVLGHYTENLSGKCVHSPILISPSGSKFLMKQGIITIFPMVK